MINSLEKHHNLHHISNGVIGSTCAEEGTGWNIIQFNQGVRIEGVETPVSTLETNCHSVSCLTHYILAATNFKSNRAMRP